MKQASALGAAGTLIGCGDDGETAPADASAAEDAVLSDSAEPVEDTTPEEDIETLPEFDELEEYAYDGEPGPEDLFSHGVASGDPLTDGVILWTRIAGATEATKVWWEIAPKPDFKYRVAVGEGETSADSDYTFKMDVSGLEAGKTYYYRFMSLGRTSPTGRTRTAPSGPTSHVRFGVCSCAKYTSGYFHAYASLAEQDLDAVLHLGDYIYENGESAQIGGRGHLPAYEILTLDDYRQRYAQYRSDQMLQEAHRQHPFIVVWDDHESANNSFKDGAANHTEGAEGSWADRKAAAIQAYHEWMPIRPQGGGRIHRVLKYGDLIDLIMLDTRLWGRGPQVVASDKEAINDPTRQMLGDDQEKWLLDTLEASTATWRVIGQQVVMTPITAAGAVINHDQWDGYAGARKRLFSQIESREITDMVVLTGDIHSSWCGDVALDETYDPESQTGSLGVEFVAPGITSQFPDFGDIVDLAKNFNPHIRYGEVSHRGYIVLDVNEQRAQGAWIHMETITQPETEEFFAAAYHVEKGVPFAVEDTELAPAREDRPAKA